MNFLRVLTNRKTIAIISIILIVIVGWISYRVIWGGGQDNFSTAVVERGDIVEKVSSTGSLVPVKRISLTPEKQAKVKNVLVGVGDQVQENETLIELEDSQEIIAVNKARADLNTALNQVDLLETQLENAKQNLERVKSAGQERINKASSDVGSAETTLNSKQQNLQDVKEQQQTNLLQTYEDARSTLNAKHVVGEESLLVLEGVKDDYFTGTKQVDLKVQDRIEIADVSMNSAESSINTADQLETKSATSQAIESLKEALESLRSALSYIRNEAMEDPSYEPSISSADKTSVNTQKENIETAISGVIGARQDIQSQEITHTKAINDAQSQVDTAQSALTSARADLTYARSQVDQEISSAESQVSQIEKELQVKRSQLSSERNELNRSQQDLEDTVIRAPQPGTITQVDIEKGETASQGTVIVKMIPDAGFKIEADISEVDIGNLNNGDKVIIDFDAFPNEEFQGHVSKIYPAEIVKEGVIYYRVEILLDEYPDKLKSGLTANLEIITDQKQDTLLVPYVAIQRKEGKTFVRIADEGQIKEEREVQIGIEGDTMVEIIKGVSAGERVVTYKEEE